MMFSAVNIKGDKQMEASSSQVANFLSMPIVFCNCFLYYADQYLCIIWEFGYARVNIRRSTVYSRLYLQHSL